MPKEICYQLLFFAKIQFFALGTIDILVWLILFFRGVAGEWGGRGCPAPCRVFTSFLASTHYRPMGINPSQCDNQTLPDVPIETPAIIQCTDVCQVATS